MWNPNSGQPGPNPYPPNVGYPGAPAPGMPPVNPLAPGMVGPGMVMDKKMQKKMKKAHKKVHNHHRHGKPWLDWSKLAPSTEDDSMASASA
ncbi:proline-rich protein 13 isoform X2 [Saccopteryx bilineata]|uniref:proline-rich protein 13 isoform X2 n=1 Tax=Saccopteryx bilineata TaxID=59482 RepID=UPI00338E0459